MSSKLGFTLIEVLISLIIVTIIVLSYLSFLTNSQLLLKRANERLKLLQLADNKVNQLQSICFCSPKLAKGMHNEVNSSGEKISWQVSPISPELKEIILQVSDKKQQIKVKLYRSLFMGGSHE